MSQIQDDFKNVPIFVRIFRSPDFCPEFSENPDFFKKDAYLNKLYPVLDYLRLNLNMQPFIVLYNQNIPEFYFRIPLYLNIQAFRQIGRR